MELFYDTETSYFYKDRLAFNHPKQSWVCQLAAILSDEDLIYAQISLYVKPYDRTISKSAENVHGISVSMCEFAGMDESSVIGLFLNMARRADTLVAHNVSFDQQFVESMIQRGLPDVKVSIYDFKHICTMKAGTPVCKLPPNFPGADHKWPKLEELYKYLFGEDLVDAHDAMADVKATRRCYYAMRKLPECRGWFPPLTDTKKGG